MMSNINILIKGKSKNVIVKESDIIFTSEAFIRKDENIPNRINTLKNNIDAISKQIIYSHIISDSSYDFEKTALFGKPVLKMIGGSMSISSADEGLLTKSSFNVTTMNYVSHNTNTSTCPIKVTPSTVYTITRYGNSGKWPTIIYIDKNGSLIKRVDWCSWSTFDTPNNCEYVILICEYATSFALSIQ